MRHAFRNRSAQPAVMVIVTTNRIGRFFLETGTPMGPDGPDAGPPSAEQLERFLAISERHGHWIATLDENAAVGLSLPIPR